MESLTALQERRALQCRLRPDRVLRSVEEADEFLRDRGLLTRTADCALPSLYEACHEDPHKTDSPGFGAWPATRWPWFGELAERGYLVAAVHRGKNLLVTGEVAGLLDPICRAEIERMRSAGRCSGRLLDHLAAAGPSSIDDLRAELGLKRQELRSLRATLERCGAIISRSLQVTPGEGHQHSSELARWDQAHPGTGGTGTPQPGAQGATRRRRACISRRARTRAAALVLLAVVLDGYACRRPNPPGAASQGRRSRYGSRPDRLAGRRRLTS